MITNYTPVFNILKLSSVLGIIFSLICLYSACCMKYPTDKIKTDGKNLEIMAIECMIRHLFPLTDSGKEQKTIYIDDKMKPLTKEWKGLLGSVQENCSFCKRFKEEYYIKQLPEIESSANIKLWDYTENGYNGGDLVQFSALIETDNPDLFCIYTEHNTSFGSSTIASFSLMIKENNGFRYLTNLNGIAIFQ